MEACKQFYTVRYTRLPELLNELTITRNEGIYNKIINHYSKVSLLILDEWMLWNLSETEAHDLLELVQIRHKEHLLFSVLSFLQQNGTKRLVKLLWLMPYLIVSCMILMSLRFITGKRIIL